MTAKTVHLLFLLLGVLLQSASGQVNPNQCTERQLGIDHKRKSSDALTNEFLYINTINPSDCWGTIQRIDFCYYEPSISLRRSSSVYQTVFGIYRSGLDSDGSLVYNLVSEVFTVQRTQSEVDNDLDYDDGEYDDSDKCRNFDLSEPVVVNPGDVLGACIFDPPESTIHRLDMVRETGDTDEILLTAAITECSSTTLPQTVSDFSMVQERILHLYADISPLPATEAPPPTTPAPTTTEATTEAPTTEATTEAPTTEATTEPPTTLAPTTEATTKTGTVSMRFPTKAATNQQTTIPATEDAGTTSNAGGTDEVSQEANRSIVAITVPAVLGILILGAVFGFIMILLMRKRRRKTQQLNIQGRNGRGMENVMYTKSNTRYGVPEAATIGGDDYDEVVEIKMPLDNKTDMDYECIDEDQDYDFPDPPDSCFAAVINPYAEVGPYNEDDYEQPMDSEPIRFSILLEKNKERDLYDHISPYQVPATKERELYSQLKSWGTKSIPLHEIRPSRNVSPNEFKSVERGFWRNNGRSPQKVELRCLTKTSEEDRVKFLQEAAIMAQFRHSNVILLHGVVIQGNPMMMVTEQATNGNLRDFLTTLKPKPTELVSSHVPQLLLKSAQQVALGMQYLSAKGFVHRDLAARNVFMTSNNICKIAEFGMSRNLADESYYVSQGGRIAVKWTAPEAIHYKKYSTASDVWAYGCLLYEIWSLGHKPFEGIQNIDVINLVGSGKRLPPPPGCPKMIYELMTICWHPQTKVRPGFRDVVVTLVGSEEVVLCIPEEDSSTHPLAGVLGAPLEAGENMYQQLQNRYIDYVHKAGMDADTDYFDVL